MASFFTFGGFLIGSVQEERRRELDLLKPFLEEGAAPTWTGYVEQDPEKGDGFLALTLRLESVEQRGILQRSRSGVRLIVYDSIRSSNQVEYPIGERIRFRIGLHRPKNYSNPGGFDYRAFLERRNILLVGTVKTTLQIERLQGRSGNLFLQYSAGVRRSFSGFLQKEFSRFGKEGERTSAMMDGLLFGRQERLDKTTEKMFQETGTYHIFVVSGFNTTLIAVFLIWCFRCLRFPVWLQLLLTAAALLFYMVMADMNLPVVRATVLSMLVLMAEGIWRQAGLLNSLCFSVLAIVFFWPESARDTGFILTFFSCLAIACLALPLTKYFINPWRFSFQGLFAPNVQFLQTGCIRRWARRLHFQLELLVERSIRATTGDRNGTLTRTLQSILVIVGNGLFYFTGILIVSLSIHLLLAPLMADLFHRANLLSAPANLLIVPVMTLLLLSSLGIGGLLWLGQISWDPWVLSTLWISEKTLTLLGWFSSLDSWHWRTPSPPFWWMSFYYALWILFLLPLPRQVRFCALLLALLCFPTFLWTPFPIAKADGAWEVWFLDVGHGDAILHLLPDGRTMLVDGGGSRGKNSTDTAGQELDRARFDIGEDVLCPSLWALRVKRLDFVLLTHPESDHAGGLPAVLANFPVGELWGPWPEEKWIDFHPALKNAASEKGLSWQGLIEGDTISIGGVTLEVWNPPETLLGPYSRVNNRSVVLLGRYGTQRLLLTGDLEKRAEFELLRRCAGLQAQVLKVAHHGSETSSTQEFLDCVRPEYAIISAKERFSDIPKHGNIMERLAKTGTKTYQTSEVGAIHVRFFPQKTEVYPFLAP